MKEPTKIVNVGPDELGEYEFDKFPDFDFFVYYYEDHHEDYYGAGNAIGYFAADGKLRLYNLGHCSCYGPGDSECGDATVVTPEEFFEDVQVSAGFEKLTEKVRELLAGVPA